ncbi:hypothetical protein JW887_00760 [Candidatus Dojkabacteria bacterium]|nr:hypothetical protein [Candidatus Dojkabacteria bacterium]
MKKDSLILIGLLSLLIITATAIGLFYFTKNKKANESKVYDKIEIRSLDASSESYGNIWIEDKSVKYDVDKTDVVDFILEHKKEWETKSQEYDCGTLENGSFTDSSCITKIGDDDFIFSIYTQIDDEFNDKYDIHLIEKK